MTWICLTPSGDVVGMNCIFDTTCQINSTKQGIIHGKNIKAVTSHNRNSSNCFTHHIPGNQDHKSPVQPYHVWTGTWATFLISLVNWRTTSSTSSISKQQLEIFSFPHTPHLQLTGNPGPCDAEGLSCTSVETAELKGLWHQRFY